MRSASTSTRIELRARAEVRAHRALGVGARRSRGSARSASRRSRASTSNSTPALRRSCANTLPNVSSAMRPTNAERPPNAATPTAVLAAEPPDVSCAGPELRVDLVGAGGVDHRHRAALDAGAGDDVVGLVAEHVDQRVPERDDVDRRPFGVRRRHRRAPSSTTGVSPPSPCAWSSGGRSRRPTVCVRP